LTLLSMLGACAAPRPAPEPPPPPEPRKPEPVSRHKAVNPLVDGPEDRSGKIKTWGVMGTIDRQVTEKGLGVRFPAVVGCFERQVKKEPYLGGQMKLSFRIDSKGKVKQIILVESDLGSLVVERCVLSELMRAAFPPPRGGETEFSFPLTFSGNMEPNWWGPKKVRRRLRRLERGLEPEKVPPGLMLTFYVDRRGRVVSVGMSADGPIDEALADDLERQLRRLRFSRPRTRYAKVTYPLQPPEAPAEVPAEVSADQ
jgi:hypothetical protein